MEVRKGVVGEEVAEKWKFWGEFFGVFEKG